MRLSFQFVRLAKTAEVVLRDHPTAEELVYADLDDLIHRILALVSETPLELLPAIARSFNRKERLASLDAYVAANGAELRRKMEIVLTAVPRKEHIRPAWRCCVHHCTVPGFLKTISAIADGVKKKFENPTDPRYALMLDRFATEDLYGRVIQELEEMASTLEDWVVRETVQGTKIPLDSTLAKQLRRAVLTRASGKLLLHHGTTWLRSSGEELRDKDYQEFGAHYLSEVAPNQWADSISDDIIDKYELPAGGHSFWKKVPKSVRDIFQKRMAEKKLKEFFKDLYDPDNRFAFWREHIVHFVDVKFPIGREQLFIAFKRFGVVEFRDTGNAAYFYEKDHFPWVMSQIGEKNEFLKDQYKAFHRLIHSGNWERKMNMILDGFFKGHI